MYVMKPKVVFLFLSYGLIHSRLIVASPNGVSIQETDDAQYIRVKDYENIRLYQTMRFSFFYVPAFSGTFSLTCISSLVVKTQKIHYRSLAIHVLSI